MRSTQRLPRELVRAVVRDALADPATPYRVVAARYGVDDSTVYRLVAGRHRAAETADLRAAAGDRPRRQRGSPRKLTPAQARDVAARLATAPELARRHGISVWTVKAIWAGRRYRDVVGQPTCGDAVSWWDGEYEGSCELDPDHAGLHHDGLSWWDDAGTEVSAPTERNDRP